MFWRFGLISAWRNLARSVLALLSMALAAAFLTNAISLSRGYAQMYYRGYRSLLGGEISAYSLRLNAFTSQTDTEWRYRELSGVGDTDLAVMMPELLENGYITSTTASAPFNDANLQAMTQLPAVKAVYPRYQIPAMSSGSSNLWATPLRGRDLKLDTLLAQPPPELISDGRWFSEEDQGAMVAVVTAQQHYPAEQRAIGVGDLIRVVVPGVKQYNGETFYDYTEPFLIELRVIGLLDIPTRTGSYTEWNAEEGRQVEVRSQLYAQNDEIQLPLATWQKIWNMIGGGTYQPRQLSLMVDDLSYLEDVVAALRQRFPENSFYSVPELIGHAESNFLLENPEKLTVNQALAETLLTPTEQEQTVLALDLRLPLIALIFLNAALVIASNLLIMVNERKTEIGIFKAVGATRGQVAQMILSEALLVSTLGALLGFGFFRVPAVFNQLTNGVGFLQLLSDVLRDLSVVLGVTGVSSLVLGLLPALLMANLSVREVLQSE